MSEKLLSQLDLLFDELLAQLDLELLDSRDRFAFSYAALRLVGCLLAAAVGLDRVQRSADSSGCSRGGCSLPEVNGSGDSMLEAGKNSKTPLLAEGGCSWGGDC